MSVWNLLDNEITEIETDIKPICNKFWIRRSKILKGSSRSSTKAMKNYALNKFKYVRKFIYILTEPNMHRKNYKIPLNQMAFDIQSTFYKLKLK